MIAKTVKLGSRVRSEGDTLVVQEVHGSWIVGRNPRGHFVVANRNPHTKRWDSLEWEKTLTEASLVMHRRAKSDRDPRRATTNRRDPTKSYAWEVWSLGDPSFHDEPTYVASYSDKGQAQARMARMKRSHPHVRYTLKHRRVEARRLFSSTRATRKGLVAWQKRIGG